MFGTNWPMLSPQKCLAGLSGLGLSQEQSTAFLSGTARRAFMPQVRAATDFGPVRRLDIRFACERQMLDFGIRYTLHSDAGVQYHLTKVVTMSSHRHVRPVSSAPDDDRGILQTLRGTCLDLGSPMSYGF